MQNQSFDFGPDFPIRANEHSSQVHTSHGPRPHLIQGRPVHLSNQSLLNASAYMSNSN